MRFLNFTNDTGLIRDLDSDALHLTHLSHLIFDVTHLDSKNRSLLDMPEAFDDVFRHVLGNKGIMDRLRDGKMKIVMY